MVKHIENFNIFIENLNKENINYVIIRGFLFMPERPDTDLDVIIEFEQFDKVIKIFKQLSEKEIVVPLKKIHNYGINKGKQLNLFVGFTIGDDGENLPNKAIRLDVMKSLCFSFNKKYYLMPEKLIEHIFKNKKPYLNFYVPDFDSEVVLLILRNVMERNGAWKQKHKNRIETILPETNRIIVKELLSLLFPDSNVVCELLYSNNLDEIRKHFVLKFIA